MKDAALSHSPVAAGSTAVLTHPVIGIDIGGTKINAAVVTPDARTLQGLLNQPTPTDANTFLQTLTAMIGELQREYKPSAVGISTAGVVDAIHGRILGSTGNMPALSDLPNLRERLEALVKLPVHIENDANAAAYGEWCSGAASGATNMFAVTLGTGVGMGIVFNGQMYRGSHFYAGEGGHIAISFHRERRCTCGRWDCWEAFASGTGLQKTAELAVEAAPESVRTAFLNQYCEADKKVTTYAIIAAWKDGHPLGVQVMDEWHHHIAAGLGSLINVMDPDMIVVGGGLAQFVDFDRLRERTIERTISDAFQLCPAKLGNDAGIVGAAYLAMEALG